MKADQHFREEPPIRFASNLDLGRVPSGGDRFWQAAARIPAVTLVILIRIYQYTLSPALPILTMGRCGCRFAPTCSHYAVEAIQVHGLLRGVALATMRLLKCTPLHPGGLDPVPPRPSPVCQPWPVAGRASPLHPR